MRLLLIFILLNSAILSSAQINKDSLLIILQDEAKETTTRLEALRHYCTNDFLYENPEQAIQLSKMGIDLARGKELKNEMAFGWYCMGVANNNLGKTDDAILFQNKSIELSQSIKDTTMLTKALNNLGNIYLNKSDFSNAINSYRKCQKLLAKKRNERGEAICKNNIGLVYYDLKDYGKSLEYLNGALDIYRKLGLEKSQANTLINIGTVFRFQNKYDEALSFYHKGLALKKGNNVKHGLGTCYSNIGLIHRAKKEEAKAMEYFQLSLKLHQEMNYKKGIARNLIHLSEWYFLTEKDSTIHLATKALNLAKESNHSAEIADAAELLFKSYESLGNYQEALKMQTLFQNLRDSMYNVKTQQAVLKSEYDLKHEEKIEHYKNEIKENLARNRSLLLFLVVAFIVTVLGFVFSHKKRKTQNLAKQNKLFQEIESLKKKLAAQLVSTPVEGNKTLALDKEKIEKAINSKLGESSWMILNLIFKNPSISNKEIAKEVSLSLEGVSSSLRRMYQAFNITTSSNKKITLIMRATRLSFEN